MLARNAVIGSSFKVFEIPDSSVFSDSDNTISESLATATTNNGQTETTERRSTSESAFISLLFAIIVSWILVALWTRTIENFVFGTLELNGDSTVHSLIVSVALSIIFFMLIWMLDQYDVIIGGIERIVESDTVIPAS